MLLPLWWWSHWYLFILKEYFIDDWLAVSLNIMLQGYFERAAQSNFQIFSLKNYSRMFLTPCKVLYKLHVESRKKYIVFRYRDIQVSHQTIWPWDRICYLYDSEFWSFFYQQLDCLMANCWSLLSKSLIHLTFISAICLIRYF